MLEIEMVEKLLVDRPLLMFVDLVSLAASFVPASSCSQETSANVEFG